MFFQNKEDIFEHTHYNKSLYYTSKLPYCPHILKNNKINYAYNCGVVGCNNLEIIKLWKELVDEFLFTPSNISFWKKSRKKYFINHLFEQYFISLICESNNFNVGFLLKEDFMRSALEDFKMTHLWGSVKKNKELMLKICNRLFLEYPNFYDNIFLLK